jgi:hypothetical protein
MIVTEVTAPMARTLKAKGFTKDQINEIAHAMHTITEASKGPPLGTVVLGDDGHIYVRVALADQVFGPVPHWRVVDVQNGDASTFSSDNIIAGTTIHDPEKKAE